VTRALETSSGFNAMIAGLLLQGLPPGEAAHYAERLAAVSPAEAADVARRYVRPEQASLIVVGNAAAFLEDLRRIRADVTVIPASDLDLSEADLTAD
jgi:zinc protease